jgi:hypothetical protein
MGANSKKVMHVDTRNFPIYDSEDLDYFQRILNDIMDEHGSRGSLSISEKEYLRVQLAAAIFRSAAAGERDYARLRRSAIEAVAVPSSDRRS